MSEEQTREIELDGVKVEETSGSTTYRLRLLANGADFPNLDRKVKENAERRSVEKEDPLAFITYYVPSPNSSREHKVYFSIWKLDTGYLTLDADRERTAASEEEARQVVQELMKENIKHFRELERQAAAAPEMAEA